MRIHERVPKPPLLGVSDPRLQETYERLLWPDIRVYCLPDSDEEFELIDGLRAQLERIRAYLEDPDTDLSDVERVLITLRPLIPESVRTVTEAESLSDALRELVSSLRRPVVSWSSVDHLDPRDLRRVPPAACWSRESRDAIYATAGEVVDAYEAAMILGVKPGTLRVWAHRGKIAVDHYTTSDWDGEPGGGQKIALYLLKDVLRIQAERSS